MLETIRELMERDPFVRFDVVMNSGDRFTIENPNLATLTEGQLDYCLPPSNTTVQLRLNQICWVQIDYEGK